MRRIALLVLSLVTLSRCAAKTQVHQPSAFPAYFPERPPQQFQPNYLFEIQGLESAPELSLLGKKRLLDLYRVEMKSLKPGIDRFETILKATKKLEVEVVALEEDVKRLEEETKKLKNDSPSEDKANFKFTSKAAKREYQEAYRLWNRDKNDQAMKRIEKSLAAIESRVAKLGREYETAKAALADSTVYEESQRERLKQVIDVEARLKSELAQAEDDWLHASARIEALRAEAREAAGETVG